MTLGQSRENLALLFGERRERGIIATALSHPLEHLTGHVRVEQRTTRRDRGDRVDNRLAAGLLEKIARGARDDRREQRLVVRVGREHDYLGLWPRLPDGPTRLDARPIGKAHVHDHDIRLRTRRGFDDFGHGAGFAHDAHAILTCDQATQAFAHDLVIIAQQDACLLRRQRATSGRMGSSKRKREPLPGAASTWSWPPTANARSRMFRRPWPSVAFA